MSETNYMTKNSVVTFAVLFFSVLVFSGCLTTEHKEYRLKIKKDGSGTAVIKHVNILSQKDEGKDQSFKDFAELVTDYIDGNKLQDDYPDAKIISKKLFEENNQLMGEFEMEFNGIGTFKLYKFDEDSPYMFYVDSFSETYVESNGTYNPDVMPIIFWDKNTTDFYIKTRVTDLTDDTSHVSLVEQYRKWKQ